MWVMTDDTDECEPISRSCEIDTHRDLLLGHLLACLDARETRLGALLTMVIFHFRAFVTTCLADFSA